MTPRARRYASFIQRRAPAIVLGFLLVTAALALSLRRLELRTDFEDLLPEGQPSVVALREIVARVGGVGTLNVVIESDDKAAARRFADHLAAALETRMAKELRSIDYTMAPIRSFFDKNGVLYLSVEELRELDRGIAAAVKQAKLRANPLHVELDEDEGAKQDPAAELRALEQRLRRRAAAVDRFPDGHYIGERGKLLAIFLRPSGSSLEIRGARALIDKLRGVVDELRPERYHPSLRVSFTGSVQDTVDEHETIASDLLGTSWLCAALIGLVVWLYFRRLTALALLGVTLAGGAVWAFGVAALSAGAVNAQTAFLGSIMVGTGINYGLMLLARFLEERREGRSFDEALATALAASLRPTLVAALATGIAFGVLGVARTRSFAQFGLVGGLGIVLCWGLSFTVLPALLVLFERVRWLRLRPRERGRGAIAYPGWLARLPLRRAGVVASASAVLAVLCVGAIVRALPRSLETDARELRNRSRARERTERLDDRVRAMMGETLHPAVILAKSPDHARRICQALERERARSARPAIAWCRAIDSLLPAAQEQKLALIAGIRRQLEKTPRDLLPAGARARVDELRARLDVRRLAIADLPEELRRRFRDRRGGEGVLALVAPGPALSFDVVEDLYAYADALREIRLASGEVVHSSGEQVIFADILRSIAFDAPRTTALAAAGVLLMLVLVLRRRAAVALVGGALAGGVLLMTGIAAACGVRYNFLNFVALPTTLGIGVDYPVNIHERQAQDGPGSMERALRRTGPAVVLASLTTIIGYAVLLTSHSMVLRSFGKLAIIGEVTCLVGALLLLPALQTLSSRRRVRAAARAPERAPASAAIGDATA
jgi:predicted RND superfamily exporter protein